MELVSATSDFEIEGQPYPGFPILLYDSMESCEPVNEFLRYYLLRGSIDSDNSWAVVGQALYDYFSYLVAHKRDWRQPRVGEEHGLVAAYRDYCLDTIRLAAITVKTRVIYICAFYEFALGAGWIKSLPFDYEIRQTRRPSGALAHVDSTGGKANSKSVAPKVSKRLPKFLVRNEISLLLSALKANPHHQMLVRMALQVGLRREELVTFPVSYVIDAVRKGGTSRNVTIRLDPSDGTGMRTKGSVERHIVVSRRLLLDLHQYAKQLRGERASLSSVLHSPLFLNQEGNPYAAAGKGVGRIILEAGRSVGLMVKTHMLRHTYATHTLYGLQRSRQRGIDPLVFVQNQLGHAYISQTQIYTHLLDERAEEAVLKYDDELNAMILS